MTRRTVQHWHCVTTIDAYPWPGIQGDDHTLLPVDKLEKTTNQYAQHFFWQHENNEQNTQVQPKKKVAIVGSQQIDALINKFLVSLCSPVHRTAWKSLFYLGTRITCWFTAVGLRYGDKSIHVQSYFSECALINKHRICMYGPSTIHGWRNARQTNLAKFQLFSQKLIYFLDWLSCAVAQLMRLSLSQLFPVDNGKSIKVLKGA